MPNVVDWGVAILVATVASAVLVAMFTAVVPRSRPRVATGLTMLAIALAAATGQLLVTQTPSLPPANGLDRLLVVVIPAAMLIVTLLDFNREPSRCGLFTIGVGSIISVRVLLHGSIHLTGESMAAFALIIFSGISLATLCLAMVLLAAQSNSISIPLSLAASAFIASLLVLLAGYIKGGCVGLLWSASLLGATLSLGRRQSQDSIVPLVAFGVFLLFGILFVGHFFGRVTRGDTMLVLVAPLSGWVVESRIFRRFSPWQRSGIRLLLLALLLAIVLRGAKRRFDHEMAPLLAVRSDNFSGLNADITLKGSR